MKKNALLIVFTFLLVDICAASSPQAVEARKENRDDPIWVYKSNKTRKVEVRSEVPKNCPLQMSTDVPDLTFTGRYANYTSADTWYPTWASDGNLYSPWTDGNIHGIFGGGVQYVCNSGGGVGDTGAAKIEGNDPMDLKITSLGLFRSKTEPYRGRYPCGSLVHNGIWYYGTYGLWGHYYPYMGTFPGFRISRDYGKTWTQTPHTCEPGKALFPEPQKFKGPVKFGAPHFVDFGKNMEHSPDGKAYLVAHGGTEWEGEDRKSNISWITGDQIYICRVIPSPETINDEDAYEYFAGHDKKGESIWSKDFAQVKPLIDWDNNCGCVTMTYNAPLKKYFMCVTDGKENNSGPMNSYILEADKITGSWKMVIYMENFGPQAYFLNIPSKFISDDGKTMWLCYSANYTNKPNWKSPAGIEKHNPPGSAYSFSLHEFIVK